MLSAIYASCAIKKMNFCNNNTLFSVKKHYFAACRERQTDTKYVYKKHNLRSHSVTAKMQSKTKLFYCLCALYSVFQSLVAKTFIFPKSAFSPANFTGTHCHLCLVVSNRFVFLHQKIFTEISQIGRKATFLPD